MKRLRVVDEHGLPWTLLEGDEQFERFSATKLQPEEFACWRDHFFIGFADEAIIQEAEERLGLLLFEAYQRTASDNDLMERLLHASRAYTTAHTLFNLDQRDDGETKKPQKKTTTDSGDKSLD